eukprot:9502349-Pyramimonas_sp.AAC.1
MLKTARLQPVELLQSSKSSECARREGESHILKTTPHLRNGCLNFSFRLISGTARNPHAERLARPSDWPRGATGSS